MTCLPTFSSIFCWPCWALERAMSYWATGEFSKCYYASSIVISTVLLIQQTAVWPLQLRPQDYWDEWLLNEQRLHGARHQGQGCLRKRRRWRQQRLEELTMKRYLYTVPWNFVWYADIFYITLHSLHLLDAHLRFYIHMFSLYVYTPYSYPHD